MAVPELGYNYRLGRAWLLKNACMDCHQQFAKFLALLEALTEMASCSHTAHGSVIF
jgi:hypothetical protein